MPRIARSRSTPAPVAPPPITRTSVVICRIGNLYKLISLVERFECSVPQLHSLGIAAGIGVMQARHGLTDGADLCGCQGQCVEHEGRLTSLSAGPPHIALMLEQRVLSCCFDQVG